MLVLLAATFALPAAAQADAPPSVQVRVDTSGPTTRLILSHSKRVSYAVQDSEGFLELVYGEPVKASPGSQRIGDAILQGYEMVEDRTLLFLTGPGYTNYESFELRNPFRVVLDLKGSRPSGRSQLPAMPRTRDPWHKVVVIDPGHGGSEAGAIGPTGLEEKEVALDLARRLKQELQRDRNISVVLTRDEDVRVDLDDRTATANHNRADLFLSIHLNGSGRATAKGAETYYLSTDATDNEARKLAALENKNFGVESEALAAPGVEGLELVLWDLAQNQYLAESSALGERVQRHLNTLTGTRDRGVRQAHFRVLMGATMPAVLIEVGFISNPEEEARFRGLSYRRQIVQAITSAVREFLGDLDKLSPSESVGGGGAPSP